MTMGFPKWTAGTAFVLVLIWWPIGTALIEDGDKLFIINLLVGVLIAQISILIAGKVRRTFTGK
jgi:hypothetical protein